MVLKQKILVVVCFLVAMAGDSGRKSFATEPLPPPIVPDTFMGEWAGFAHVDVGPGFLVHIRAPGTGSPVLSLAFDTRPEDVFVYRLQEVKIEAGQFEAKGIALKWAGNWEKNVVVRLRGHGVSFGDMGTFHLEVTKTFVDHHEVRLVATLVKTPGRFFSRLPKLLRASQTASVKAEQEASR